MCVSDTTILVRGVVFPTRVGGGPVVLVCLSQLPYVRQPGADSLVWLVLVEGPSRVFSGATLTVVVVGYVNTLWSL